MKRKLNKITITEKGQLLQQEIQKEIEFDSRFNAQSFKPQSTKHQESVDHGDSNTNHIKSQDGQHRNQNIMTSQSANDIIKSYKQQIAKQSSQIGDIKKFFLPNVKEFNMTPYLQQKIQNATKQCVIPKKQTIADKLMAIHTHLISPANITIAANSQESFRMNTSFRNKRFLIEDNNNNEGHSITQAHSKTREHQKLLQNPEIQNDRYNKMIFYEAKFQRMLDKHEQLKEQRKSFGQILNNLQAKNQKKQDLVTRPETLAEIRSKNQEVNEILYRSTHINERIKDQIYEIHRKKYLLRWNRSYFPKKKGENGVAAPEKKTSQSQYIIKPKEDLPLRFSTDINKTQGSQQDL